MITPPVPTAGPVDIVLVLWCVIATGVVAIGPCILLAFWMLSRAVRWSQREELLTLANETAELAANWREYERAEQNGEHNRRWSDPKPEGDSRKTATNPAGLSNHTREDVEWGGWSSRDEEEYQTKHPEVNMKEA